MALAVSTTVDAKTVLYARGSGQVLWHGQHTFLPSRTHILVCSKISLLVSRLTVSTDEPAKFIVNTSKAGSGALAVTVDGPSKVQLESREVAEGHEFTYTPTMPGDYLIVIKFAGSTHIPGSPFRARITGVPPCCSIFSGERPWVLYWDSFGRWVWGRTPKSTPV